VAAADVKAVIADLKRSGSAQFRVDMVRRYGIVTNDETFGAPMAKIKAIAKPLGKNHKLAQQLWESEIYDARILASMVGDPALLSAAEMDRWCKGFDNWGVCDTLCFNLFDRSPHAWAKIDAWAKRKSEFEKRAAFALLATMALHKRGAEADLLKRLPLIEAASTDERNFVKKGVNWALRAMKRGGPKARAGAIALARKLAESEDKTARWIGKDALRDLMK
jgi:3-methyladenine DNA glycosylase AlkD